MIRARYLFVLLFLVAYVFGLTAYFGSYALEIITPSGGEKKPIDFDYITECLDNNTTKLTIHVFDKKRPAKEVDAYVALKREQDLVYVYTGDTEDGVITFYINRPGSYNIIIRPEASYYKTIKKKGAVDVPECAPTPLNETNATNITNITNATLPEKEEGKKVPTERVASVCSSTVDVFFEKVGDVLTFYVERDGQPYSGEAVLESPEGRRVVEIEGGTFSTVAEREGYYALEVKDCLMKRKDYVLATRPVEEAPPGYVVKGIRAYNGCVLTLYSDTPYSGVLIDERGEELHIPLSIGEFNVMLREGTYDFSAKGNVQVSLRCPERRVLFEKDITFILATIAAVFALLYVVYLMTAVEVEVKRVNGKWVVYVRRKFTKSPVRDLKVSLFRGEELLFEDLTDDEGKVVLPKLPLGTYYVRVGNIRKEFSIEKE